MNTKVLVIAPHPDDEVLGVGASIHRASRHGAEVTVAICTHGWEPQFPAAQVAQVRGEAQAAAKTLGVHHLKFLDLPVTKLHALPEHELNATFDRLVQEVKPDAVWLPFGADRHEDHRQIFDACMVALRPVADRAYVNEVLCYETVSETHWTVPQLEPAFEPLVWVDIAADLEAKLEAMRCYASQLRPAPAARSLDAIRALATWRGSVVGMVAAECFAVVRQLRRPGSPT